MSTKLQFMISGAVLCIAAVLFAPFTVSAQMRIWHTKDGARFEAEFLREKPGKVFLKGTDKQNVTVALTNLVANDIEYIRTKILPDVEIEFIKTIRQLERSEYARQTDYTMEVNADVTVRRTSRALFEGQFTGEVYLIAKEVATDDYRLFSKKGFVVRFPEDSRQFVFNTKASVTYYEEFTTEARGAEYEGYVVILFDLDGNPMAFDTNLTWMDETRIDALRELPVPGFFDQQCRKRSVPRPQSGTPPVFDFSY